MPRISLKSEQQIALMAEGGEKLGQILTEVLGKVCLGISTLEIDSWIEDRIINVGGEPSFKSVPHYHWSSCVGLNNEVVHSIPTKDKILKEGDLLKIDLGMFWRTFHTDLAWTILVQSSIRQPADKVQSYQREFLNTGERALEEAIKVAVVGKRVGHISQRIQEVIESGGYYPVRVLTGHGIGRQLHEEPLIPGILQEKLVKTPKLVPGMTLAIEIIYGFGSGEVVLEDDGWTVCSKDGKIAGLFEKTIAITHNGPLILTPLGGIKETKCRGYFVC